MEMEYTQEVTEFEHEPDCPVRGTEPCLYCNGAKPLVTIPAGLGSLDLRPGIAALVKHTTNDEEEE